MVDDLDPRLEADLRAVLHAHVESVSFTLTAADLEGRRVERTRARDRRRVATAAAVVFVAVGIAAIGTGLLRPDGSDVVAPAATLSAGSPVPTIGPSGLPADLAGFAELQALLAAPINVTRGEGGPGTTVLADVSTHDSIDVAISCIGGSLDVRVVDPTQLTADTDLEASDPGYGSAHVTCPSSPSAFSIDVNPSGISATRLNLAVDAPEGVAWRLFAAAPDPNASPTMEGCTPVTSVESEPRLRATGPTVGGFVMGEGTQQYASYGADELGSTEDTFVPGRVERIPIEDADTQLTIDVEGACVLAWKATWISVDDIERAVSGGGSVPVTDLEQSATTNRSVALGGFWTSGERILRLEIDWYTGTAVPARTIRVWRFPDAQALATPSPIPSGYPTLDEPLPGSTTLFETQLGPDNHGDRFDQPTPAGTDEYLVRGECYGTGTLEVEIDGVGSTWPCELFWLRPFTLDGDGRMEGFVRSAGDARVSFRVDARDLERIDDIAFIPPRLRVRTEEPPGAAPAYAGCGLGYQGPDGGSFADDCGPSWQAIANPLRVHPGATVTLRLADDWTITAASGAIGAHDAILPDSEPTASELRIRSSGGSYTFVAPERGDWGVGIRLTATKDGATFSVPYYTRVIVEP